MVEQRRLRHAGQAADIAWGAVVARVLVVLLKVLTTLILIGFLGVGLYRESSASTPLEGTGRRRWPGPASGG